MNRLTAPLTVAAVAVAAFGIWEYTTRHTATPEVREGLASPNANGTAITLHDNGYVVAGTPWAGPDDGAPGSDHVVWLRCLE